MPSTTDSTAMILVKEFTASLLKQGTYNRGGFTFLPIFTTVFHILGLLTCLEYVNLQNVVISLISPYRQLARSIFSYRPCNQALRPAGSLLPDR